MEKILAAWNYWPTMFKDTFDYCNRCKVCQAFAKKSIVSGNLNNFSRLGPFNK